MKKLALALSCAALAALPLNASELLAGFDFNTATGGTTLNVYRPSNGAQKTTAGLIVDGTVGSSNLIEPTGPATFNTGERTIAGTGSTLGASFLFNDTIDQITGFNTASNVNKDFELYTNTSAASSTGATLNGKNVVFSFSTTGWSDITLQGVAQRASGGPSNNSWAWSTDGVSYTSFLTAWNPDTSFSIFTLDLTSLSQIDNKANVYLRLTFGGQSVGTGTTNNIKFDNVQIGAATVYSGSPVATWRNTYFPGSGSEIDLVDSDHDGLNNLLEYALNSNPLASNGAPAQSVSAGRMALTLGRNPAATDVTIIVEGSDSVSGPWTGLAQSVNGAAYTSLAAGVVINQTSPSAEVSDQYTLNGTHPNRFLRVQVVGP